MTVYNTHGSLFQASDMDSGDPTYATVAQLDSVTPPGESRGSEDVFLHSGAAGAAGAKLIDALRSMGTWTITVVEDLAGATHAATTGLYSFMADDEPRDYRIVLTGGFTIQLAGYITGRTPQAMPANRGVPRVDYEFTPTAAPTVAAT